VVVARFAATAAEVVQLPRYVAAEAGILAGAVEETVSVEAAVAETAEVVEAIVAGAAEGGANSFD
jgi:hypothetical protein